MVLKKLVILLVLYLQKKKKNNVKNVNTVNKNQLFINFTKEFQIHQNDTVRLSAKIIKTNQSPDNSINDFKDNDNEEISFVSQPTKKAYSISQFRPNNSVILNKGNKIFNRNNNYKRKYKIDFL